MIRIRLSLVSVFLGCTLHCACADVVLTAARALAQSKAALPVDGAEERSQPFDLPSGNTQTPITDRDTLTALGLPGSFGTWDMVSFGAPEDAAPAAYPSASDFIFVPAEASIAAGVFRYNAATQTFATLLLGDGAGRESNPANFDPLQDNFRNLDPATYTSFGTVLTGEETTGGRLFEIQNPLAADPAEARVRWLAKVPAVAHEGLRFDAAGSLYFVDENVSGCLYKFVPQAPEDLSTGQTFVLALDGWAGASDEDWDSATNQAETRTGSATWLPLTDAAGAALTTADPFAFVSTTGGRTAADEVGATPFGRPEDIVITSVNGFEVLLFSATSENTVYSVRLDTGLTATVKVFVDRSTLDIATASAVGSSFSAPDNLAVDTAGNIYIIEDQGPPHSDIWQAVDADGDGIAEQVGRWLSNGVAGSEPSGLIFDPHDPNRALVVVQHPASGNDALWEVRTGPPPPMLPVSVALPAGGGTVTLARSGGELVLSKLGSEILRRRVADVSTLFIFGTAGGDDVLSLDMSGGDPIPASGVVFYGGVGGHDSIELRGSAADVVFDFSASSIEIDGSTIFYSGLE